MRNAFTLTERIIRLLSIFAIVYDLCLCGMCRIQKCRAQRCSALLIHAILMPYLMEFYFNAHKMIKYFFTRILSIVFVRIRTDGARFSRCVSVFTFCVANKSTRLNTSTNTNAWLIRRISRHRTHDIHTITFETDGPTD